MGRVCRSLEAHLARVREYARAHNIRTAYLATDSELVLEEARRNTEFQFLFLPNVARHRETPKVIWDKTVAQRVRKGLNKHNYREAWLATLDANRVAATAICESTYGQGEGVRWFHRWRLFYLACAEMWGYDGGNTWFVSHYLFER